MDTIITSSQNTKIKKIERLLEKSKERKQSGLFVIESIKEISMAADAGYELTEVFYCENSLPAGHLAELKHKLGTHLLWNMVSEQVFAKIAYRESTSKIVATARMRTHTLSALKTNKSTLLLVAEQIEKPGNLGALLRTADGAGATALIVCNSTVDIYNPNTIRSSVGCIFTVPIAETTTTELVSWLRAHGIQLLVATPEAAQNYTEADFTKPSAILVGAEDVGVSEELKKNSDQNIVIPMRGINDSLNVSVAAAVLLYEAVRQKSSSQK